MVSRRMVFLIGGVALVSTLGSSRAIAGDAKATPASSAPAAASPAVVPAQAPATAAPTVSPTAPASSTPAAPGTSAPARVDPKVGWIMNAVAKSYEQLPAISATFLMEHKSDAGDNTATISIDIQKPKSAKFIVYDKSGTVMFSGATNDKTSGIYIPSQKKYRTDDVPADANPIAPLLDLTQARIVMFYADPAGFEKALITPEIGATLGQTVTIDGVLTDPITANVELDTNTKAKIEADVDQIDHMIRKVVWTVTRNKDGKSTTETETGTLTKLDTSPKLAADNFVFVAPKDAEKVTPKDAGTPSGKH